MTPSGLPQDLYHCLLDEQPHYLVPERLLGSGEPDGELVVNPHCWFGWHGPLPPDRATRARLAEAMLPTEWIVWVEDPATGANWPYWVGEEFASHLVDTMPGQAPAERLPPHVEAILRQARILVGANHRAQRRRRWAEEVEQLSRSFERGYAILPELIPPLHLGALRRYYRHHIFAGAFRLGDDQVRSRYVAHNQGVARLFHEQLADLVSDVARALVKPSYSYLVAYQSGSELALHTDRPQCEYSITICIDASPEPREFTSWPLRLHTSDGVLQIWQRLGDGLVYRGRQLAHGRDRLTEGHTSTSMLLHYVDQGFEGPLS